MGRKISFAKGGQNIHLFFGILIVSLLVVFSEIIFPAKTFAVPAYDGLFELKQPSGKSFEARQHGDEWYNWVETRDGYGIYKNMASGNWEYYLPSTDTSIPIGMNIRSGRMQDSPLPSRVVVGETDPVSLGIPRGLRLPRTEKSRPQQSGLKQTTPHPGAIPQGEGEPELLGETERTQPWPNERNGIEGSVLPDRSYPENGLAEKRAKSTAVSGARYLLVIGVDYNDALATYTAEQIQPLVFGTSSVSNYYSKVSYSAVTISPATESQGTSNDGFIGWLRLSGSHPNPQQYTDANAKSSANAQIVKDAILAADSYINYASYDTDGDGYVEPTELSIMIIVAGYEASYGSPSSPSVWAHAAWGYMSVSVDGKTINTYAMFGEKHGDHLATFGVMAHELGHLMFSLPDLYDTDYSSEGIGFFCLMSGGAWGAASGVYAGSSPTHLCAWSKEYLSWGTINTITSSQTVSLPKADGNSASIFRMNTSDSNQYFLIENRQFIGYDLGFQGATGASGHGGLVIYHIDKLKTSLWPNTSNEVNADENDKGVDVEEANEGSLGYSMLDTNKSAVHTNMFFFSGNKTSFTDTTTPNSRLKNGRSTHISLTGISAYGDTMTASVVRPPTVKTGSVTNMASGSVTLNGTVNGYGEATTAWFEYGANIGSYSNTTTTQTVSGTADTTVSIDISGLSEKTTYYYRIAAQNSAGTVYGNEGTFILITVTPKIAAGGWHTIALKSNGTVWVWGYNGSGQLGDGTTNDGVSPVQVTGFSGATAIAGGLYYTLALKSDGTVWTWGQSPAGSSSASPTQIKGLSDITAIAAGGYHGLAMKPDGAVWAWGSNGNGQIGNGTTTVAYTPVQVNGMSNVTAIAGGNYHSLALKSDGTVWAWGHNGNGQLGDGTTTDRNTPVQVSGLSNVTAIAAGGYHSMALKSDGTLWTWGYNRTGQLGDGTTSIKTTPVQVSGITNVIAVSGGSNFTAVLKSDGTVWSAGAYKWFTNNGERGWYYYRNTMGQFTGISGVTAIGAGGSHYITLKPDGSVWTWGYNYNGQLGDGTTTDRDAPVQVSNINLGATVATPTPVTTPSPTPTPSPKVTPSPTPTPIASDTTPPSGSVSINSGASYTNSTAVTLSLSATDSVGVVGYYVSNNSSIPTASASGWNSITSTTGYTGSASYTLASGDGSKTVYVWYKDAAGNVSSASNASITLDTTAPIVDITSPTPDAIYTATSSTITLGGSASDATSGVQTVTWSSNKDGSGTASGTTSWTVSNINLSVGDNVITVTATDNVGNATTDVLTVTYTIPTPMPSPTPLSTPPPTPVASPTPTPKVSPTPAGTFTPTPTPKVSPTPITSPTPRPTPSPATTPEKGFVFGTVADGEGNYLSGVTVFLVGANGSSPTQNSVERRGLFALQGGANTSSPARNTTTTDADGYYEFGDVDAGNYILTYQKSGYATQTQAITLEAGQALDMGETTLEAVSSGKIYGIVVDIKGNPIESVGLKLKGVRTKVSKTEATDADGFFEFSDLSADTYVITAKKNRYKTVKKSVTIGDGESKEVEIEMRKTTKRVDEM